VVPPLPDILLLLAIATLHIQCISIYNDFSHSENGFAKKNDDPIEKTLFFTLEELYNGTIRRIKITITVINYVGYSNIEEDTLTIDVKV